MVVIVAAAWHEDVTLHKKMSKLGFRSAETGNVGNSYLAFWLSCWPRRFCLQPRPMWTCCPALWRGWCRSCRSWPGGDLSFYSVDAVDGLYYYNICIYIFKIYTYTYIYIYVPKKCFVFQSGRTAAHHRIWQQPFEKQNHVWDPVVNTGGWLWGIKSRTIAPLSVA